jgi:integrase
VGSVFRKQMTKPLPPDAEVVTVKGERVARWRNGRGKLQSAPLSTAPGRIIVESRVYFAKYRDGSGRLRVVTTGCRDKKAAQARLADLEQRAERVRAGVLTAAEAAIATERDRPLAEHIDDYLAHLEAAGCCREHRANVRRQLTRIAEECQFRRLADLDRHRFEQWLLQKSAAGMSARTRNCQAIVASAFSNWCSHEAVRRMCGNPFAGIPMLNENADPRRKRRAMTEEELHRLLAVAAARPLREARLVRKGTRKGEEYANVRPETVQRLTRLGRERALIYKTLVLTGLRKGELASLSVAQLHLDAAGPYLDLDAADEKNGEGAKIPLRHDLAAELRGWLIEKLAVIQRESREAGGRAPSVLPPDTALFDVPDKLSPIINRDLKAAGIAKRDERGRTLDVHSLRTTFGTMMSQAGVQPRVAQAAMRHSKLDLTMNVYTDPKMLDVARAVAALPALPTVGSVRSADASQIAPKIAPTRCNPAQSGAIPGNGLAGIELSGEAREIVGSALPVNEKGPLTVPVNEPVGVGATGLEPVTPSVSC